MTPTEPPPAEPPPTLAQRLLTAWVAFVCAHARAVLLLSLLATLAALAFSAATLGINTSTTQMLADDLPFRVNHEALKASFPQRKDNLVVVVEAASPDQADRAAEQLAAALRDAPETFHRVLYTQGDPFFKRNGLLYLETAELEALATRLSGVAPLLAALAADPSLRGLAEILTEALESDRPEAAEAAASLAPALDSLAASVETLAAGAPRPLSWQELIAGENEGSGAARRLLLVQPRLDFASLAPAAAAVRQIRAFAGAPGLTPAEGIRIAMTGQSLMLQEELESVRSGIGLVGLVSLILVALILGFGIRSGRLVLAILVTLFMGLSWTGAFAALAVGELNLISVAFAVLFIGLGVDFGIHYGLRTREELGKGRDQTAAQLAATAGCGPALLLCALTAAIGFFAFFPTSYRGLSELGVISGAGMFIALFASFTVLPALLTLLPLKTRSDLGAALEVPSQSALQRYAAGHAKTICWGALILAAGAALVVPGAWFDDDPLNLRDAESPSVATFVEILNEPGARAYRAEVLAPDAVAAEALAADLAALSQVKAAVTLGSLVPDDQETKLDLVDDMALFLGPALTAPAAAPPAAAAQLAALEALKAALQQAKGPLTAPAARLRLALQGLDLGDPAAVARLEALLLAGLPDQLDRLSLALEADIVGPEDLPADLAARYLAPDGRAVIEVLPAADLRDQQARFDFVAAVQDLAPGATGAPVIIAEAGQAVVRAFIEATAYALVAILVLLLVMLRSLRDSLLVMAPLILAALTTVAGAVLLGVPFNFANVIVLPLLLGLGIASGIHLVLRARQTHSTRQVMATSTPRAVLLSALTTIGSFGSLGLSGHPGTASMGVLLTVAIAMPLLATLVVLPALLAAFRPAAVTQE